MRLHIRPFLQVTTGVAVTVLALAGCDEAQPPTGTAAPGASATQSAPTATGSAQATGSQPGSQSGSSDQASAVFEVSGSGKAASLHVDDGTPQGLDLYNVPMPFHKESKVDADVDLLQVHAAGVGGHVTCRITLDGKVVVESTDSGDCVYNRPGN